MEKWDWIRRYDVIEEGEIDQIDCEFAEGGQKQYDIQPQPEAVFELDEDCSDNDNEEFSDNEASNTENDFVEDSVEESLNAEDYQKEENVQYSKNICYIDNNVVCDETMMYLLNCLIATSINEISDTNVKYLIKSI